MNASPDGICARPSSVAGEAPAWLHPATACALALLYLGVLLPGLARSWPGDDTLLLVPALLAELGGGPGSHTIAQLFAPDPGYMPRPTWRLYILASLGLFGPTNAGLMYLGLGLHAVCSGLVFALARNLGLDQRIAWLAASLHLVAYAGFHAYAWPVGVQHVLTVLGVLLFLDLYLVTDRRWRAGLPHRSYYALAGLAALASSLSRATSLIGPAAVLAHLLLGPGDAAQRRERYRLWRLPILGSLIYPCALLAYAGDLQKAETGSASGGVLYGIAQQAGAEGTFAIGLVLALATVLAGRLALKLLARAPSGRRPLVRPALWRALGIAVMVAALPWMGRALMIFASGLEAFSSPLGLALNSRNTARWHMASFPLDVVGIVLALAALAVVARRHLRDRDWLVLLVLILGFALTVSATEVHPLRYWIYVTPVFAIMLAVGLDAAWREGRARGHPRWADGLLLAVWAVVASQNIAAVRLELWRHRMADSYQALDYVRAADLIRQDLSSHAATVPTICVEGLTLLPYEATWTEWFTDRAAYGHENARRILVQALGRGRTVASIRLDCGPSAPPGAYVYAVAGERVLRSGQSIDPFVRMHERLRALAGSGDLDGARALLAREPRIRPFVLRHLLGSLPDADLEWVTNGASLLEWLDRLAANHDAWYGRADPKIQALRALVSSEVIGYVRFLVLAQYVEHRSGARAWAPAPGGVAPPLPFGALPPGHLSILIGSDAELASNPDLMRMVGEIATPPPGLTREWNLAPGRHTVDLALLSFLGRLILADYRE